MILKYGAYQDRNVHEIEFHIGLLSPTSQHAQFKKKKKKKVQVGKDQEKAHQKKIPTPKTEVGKNQTNNQVLIP